jgi:hypothetical protein
MKPVLALLVAAAASAAGSAPIAAQDSKAGPRAETLELNKLESRDGACRAYLVLDNPTQAAFDSFKLDLVLFGTDGVILRRMAVETAPLRAEKKVVKLFDIAGAEPGSHGDRGASRVSAEVMT